jgi:adenylate cyclase
MSKPIGGAFYPDLEIWVCRRRTYQGTARTKLFRNILLLKKKEVEKTSQPLFPGS